VSRFSDRRRNVGFPKTMFQFALISARTEPWFSRLPLVE
jgi:hypothetical protein